MRTFPSPSPAPPTAACRRRTACGSPQLVSTPRPRWPVLTRRRMAGFEVSIEARAMAAALPGGRDERVQAPGHAGGRARAQAGTGKGGRADDEARDRGVVPRKKRVRGGVEEVETLRGAVSPGTRARYTVTLICEALHAPRSSVYAVGPGRAPADGR